ncbi:hypothetical protein PCASD_14447 [Puccinia coronata f. sp. avenae]|uniref:Uncharacterized protein n=1 Tax=Puccinia coronata f. sp. avenae TaxID=200324 RepID=A0A2N5UDS3_9BASI|nr:hypothetical protein PCASD_14447 [Puccinia coronata f. sp. avenae]
MHARLGIGPSSPLDPNGPHWFDLRPALWHNHNPSSCTSQSNLAHLAHHPTASSTSVQAPIWSLIHSASHPARTHPVNTHCLSPILVDLSPCKPCALRSTPSGSLPHSFRPRSATLVIILWNTLAIATSEVNTDLGQVQ